MVAVTAVVYAHDGIFSTMSSYLDSHYYVHANENFRNSEFEPIEISTTPEILGESTNKSILSERESELNIYPFPQNQVTINIGDRSESIFTDSLVVKEILNSISQEFSLGIYYHNLDDYKNSESTITNPIFGVGIPEYMTIPDSSAVLKPPYQIKIIELKQEVIESHYEIDFDTQIIKNSNLELGNENIIQEGSPGKVTEIIKTIYKNGTLAEEVVLSKKVDRQPQTRIIEIGTKVVIPADQTGCEYWDKVIDSKTQDSEEREWLKEVMRCESTCNSKADSGTYKGLFQFHPNTFERNSEEGMDIWNGGDQIDVTLKMIRNGRKSAWGCH